MNDFLLQNGALDPENLQKILQNLTKNQNFGAIFTFSGVVRAEKIDDGEIFGLSFDAYEPLLRAWFLNRREIAQNAGVRLFFAHSFSDVFINECSFFCAAMSQNRKNSIEILPDFIEDFKRAAPIWKYDLVRKNEQVFRIFAKDRSQILPYAGILS